MRPNALILGTQPATPLTFQLAVLENEVIELDDLVCVESYRPDNHAQIRFYGVVEQASTISEGLSFVSDTIDAREGLMPARTAYTAYVRVLRIVPESFLPPQPGDPVYVCRAGSGVDDRIAEALFLDQMQRRLPAGMLRNGSPLFLNFDYIDGAKGGHINISGVAGVAAKTSTGLFLVKGIFESGVLGKYQSTSRGILFNVKGEDLFHIDKANKNLSEEDKVVYRSLGLKTDPFRSVGFYAAPQEVDGTLYPNLEQRSEGVLPYVWSMRTFCRDGLLPFAFPDEDLERGVMGFLISIVTSQLAELATDRHNDGADNPQAQEAPYLNVPEGYCHRTAHRVKVQTYAELVSFLYHKLLTDGDGEWTGGAAPATCQAFLRRMRGLQEDIGQLVRGDLSVEDIRKFAFDPVTATEYQLSVIDINKITSRAQKFVVGVVLNRIFKFKEATGRHPTYFIFLDELNKYAPRDGRSPIRQLLIDIAERGRSLGVILIGAQQAASRVAESVISQASIRIAGRLDGAEAEKPDYRFLGGTARDRAMLLTSGSVFVFQPEVPAPMLVRLPMPACATRKDEVLEDRQKQEDHDARF